MQENNRHILINGLNDLPIHMASPGLWERIEIMKLDVPHEALPVHSPQASTWEAIRTGISRKPAWMNRALNILAMIALIISIGGVGWYYYSHSNNKADDPQENTNAGFATTGKESQSVPGPGEPAPTEQVQASHSIVSSSTTIAVAEKKPEEAHTNSHDKLDSSDDEGGVHLSRDFILISSLQHRSGKAIYSDYYNIDKKPSLVEIEADAFSPINDPFDECGFKRNEHAFHLSPGFEYQYLFKNNLPEGTKNSYWYAFDLSIIYKLNRFSFESGLMFGSAKDKSEVSYNYLANEIIHTYVYVDSIYYDPVSGTTQFFTTTVDVYDSVAYTNKTSVENKYTYLQIPLEIAYKFFTSSKFCMTVKAGITYYMQINHKEIYPDIYHEDSRITSMMSSESKRKEEFFRFSGGLEFNYHLNDRIELSAKPAFNYFLNPIWETNEIDKNPMGIGVRLGLVYKL